MKGRDVSRWKQGICGIMLVAGILLGLSGDMEATPVPDIKINGMDGTVILKQSDTMTISVGMDSGGETANSDWWFVFQTPFGIYLWNAGGVNQNIAPLYQGPVVSFPPVPLLQLPVAALPPGVYAFYFGVDTIGNGSLDFGSLAVDSSTLIIVTPTAKGTPMGPAAVQNIGPSGGTVSSSGVTLTIPAGALSVDTPISITPVTNTAHAKVGNAFQLGPDGQTFTVPVQVSMQLSDQDRAQTSIENLTIAVQDGSGYWSALDSISFDRTAKTVTASTSHFSGISLGTRFMISAKSDAVKVNESLGLTVVPCFLRPVGALMPFEWDCSVNYDYGTYPDMDAVLSWSVDGAVGGNGTVGNVIPTGDVTARYTAPAKVPAKNPVTVTARYRHKGEEVDVQGELHIYGENTYSGKIQYAGGQPGTKFIAELETLFTRKEGIPGGEYYTMSGTMDVKSVVTISEHVTCDVIPTKFQFDAFESTGATALQIFTSVSNANTYDLHFLALSPMLTAHCTDRTSTPPRTFTQPLVIGASFTTNCTPSGKGAMRITDINHLKETSYQSTCQDMALVSWDLTSSLVR